MNYPISMSFKILTLAPQIRVMDADGNIIFYVKQKMFRLKEAVTVFSDTSQSESLFSINADRVIDWSAKYIFRDSAEQEIGAVKRQGMRSLWKAHYDILQGEESVMHIQEANPWVKVLDSLLGEIPIIGFLVGFFLNPSYHVKRDDGTHVLTLKKMPAFFEGKFQITKEADLSEEEETRALLSLMMMVLLERRRG